MPIYHVHLYPIVRVTVRDVAAGDQVEAIKKAEELVDMDKLFAGLGGRHVASIGYAEDLDGFLVDEDGDEEHENTTWYDKGYKPF